MTQLSRSLLVTALVGLHSMLFAQSFPLFNRFEGKPGAYSSIEQKFYSTNKEYAISSAPMESLIYEVNQTGYMTTIDVFLSDLKEHENNLLASRIRTVFSYQTVDGYELVESFVNKRPDAPTSSTAYVYTTKRIKDTVVIRQQRKGEAKSHRSFYLNADGKILREIEEDHEDVSVTRHEFSYVLDKQGRPIKRTHRANGRVLSIESYVYNAEGFLSEKKKIMNPGKLDGFLYNYTYVLNAEGNWTEQRCASHVLDSKGKILNGYTSYSKTTRNYLN